MTERRLETSVEIAAPREAVWRALVEPEALVGWFASDARVTPEPGGEYWIAHGDHAAAQTIEEIVPNERLRMAFREIATEFVLEGNEGTTVLRIVQSGFTDDVHFDSNRDGWAAYLQTLRHYLEHHASEPAECVYRYAATTESAAAAWKAVRAAVPAGAEVFDDQPPLTVGATMRELGDGVVRAMLFGEDGDGLVWFHLVAYGDGRTRLGAIAAEIERALSPTFASHNP